jgi:hypothetical protein
VQSEELLLLALRREEVEKEVPSVALVEQPGKESQTIRNVLVEQGVELPAVRGHKKHCKVLAAEGEQSEEVIQRLLLGHDPQHNRSSNQDQLNLMVSEPGRLKHKLGLPFQVHPQRHQHPRLAMLPKPGLRFPMHSNAGKLYQHIGRA